MRLLDLFSGIGGFSYGLEKIGFKTVAFCEMDKYCKLVLQKHWKGIRIYNDVKEITKERLEADGIESPDIITGGFPCQPFSIAGKQKGTNDDRHLWPEMFRIIKELKPRWIIGENVRGIVNIQDGVVFETVCTDLESEGYEVQAFNIPAAGVGAPHRRERIWIVAHSNDTRNRTPKHETNKDGQKTDERRQEQSQLKSSGHSKDVENSRRTLRQGTELREKNEDETRKEDADQHQRSSSPSESDVADTHARLSDGTYEEIQSGGQTLDTSSERVTEEDGSNTDRTRLQRLGSEHKLRNSEKEEQPSGDSWWQFEPDVGRVAHGVPGRVHRLKALGNSIVPKIAEEIGKAIMKAERD